MKSHNISICVCLCATLALSACKHKPHSAEVELWHKAVTNSNLECIMLVDPFQRQTFLVISNRTAMVGIIEAGRKVTKLTKPVCGRYVDLCFYDNMGTQVASIYLSEATSVVYITAGQTDSVKEIYENTSLFALITHVLASNWIGVIENNYQKRTGAHIQLDANTAKSWTR